MNRADFDHLVERAIRDLPREFQEHLENVSILVEEWPDAEILAEADGDDRGELLGFYRGVPLVDRSDTMPFESPDQIFLFRQPILEQCRSQSEVHRCIRETLHHEIAHHFGFDDDELEKLGVY